MADKLEVEVQESLGGADELIQPVGDDGATTADSKLKVGDDGTATAVESPQPVVEEKDEADEDAAKVDGDTGTLWKIEDKARWHQRSLEECNDIQTCASAAYTKLMGLYNLAQPNASGVLAKLTKIHSDLEKVLDGLV